MPIYRFHSVNGTRTLDEEGHDCADDRAALRLGIEFAGHRMLDEPELLDNGEPVRVEVMNPQNRLIVTILTMAVHAPASGRA